MADTDQGLRFAEAMAARLCHDLSGPIGTLVNALELIDEPGEAGAEARGLAADAALQLRARLRLLRAAWAPEPEALSVPGLVELGAGLPGAHRLRLDLSGFAGGTVFPGPTGRMLLNMLLLAAGALPAGGEIALRPAAAGEVLLTVSGPRVAWPAGLAALLLAPAPAAPEPGRLFPAAMLARLARDAGMAVRPLLPAGGPGHEGLALLLTQA